MAKRVREVPAPPPDKLDRLRQHVREVRDLEKAIEDAEAVQAERRQKLNTLVHETLPGLYRESQVTVVGLEPEGNLPAYEGKIKPYYKANIAADWPEDRRAAAFAWIEDPKGGATPDIIKTIITVELGRGDRKTALKVRAGLDKAKIPYKEGLGVPWNTLTAFVKECIETRKIMPPLETLGAVAGQIVEVKPKKD